MPLDDHDIVASSFCNGLRVLVLTLIGLGFLTCSGVDLSQ